MKREHQIIQELFKQTQRTFDDHPYQMKRPRSIPFQSVLLIVIIGYSILLIRNLEHQESDVHEKMMYALNTMYASIESGITQLAAMI